MLDCLMRSGQTDTSVRWGFIVAVGLVSAGGLWASGVRVPVGSLQTQLGGFALFLAFGVSYRAVGSRVPRLAVPMFVVGDFLLSASQVLLLMLVMLPLSYLAAKPGFPLVDAVLARLDASLFGFEWDAAARWVAGRPVLDQVLHWAYFSVLYQAAAVLLIGSVARPGDGNGDFVWSFAIGILLVCAVSVFTPALGKIGHVGTGYLETLTVLRSGTWAVLDYSHSEGIITFPSFHTALAILFVHAVRRHRWALAVFVPLNVLMIASTPTIGGHYLIDLPAGAVVAFLSIAATKAIRRRLRPVPVGAW